MNRFPLARLVLLLLFALPLAGHSAPPAAGSAALSSPAEPVISAIRGRVVTVRVPAGFERVTLQALTAPPRGRTATGRAARSEWQTVGLRSVQRAGGSMDFALARLTPRRMLRVSGMRAEIAAGDLLTGITTFLADVPVPVLEPVGAGGSIGIVANAFATTSLSMSLSTNSASTTAEVRTVAEADIWKLAGDRLYFFNALRGLQVFDVRNPDDPALLGTLRMPAMGEDMYLLDAAHVVLLKKAWNWYWAEWDGDGGGVTTSDSTASLSLAVSSAAIGAAQLTSAPQRQANAHREIVIANVQDGPPRIVGRVEFTGTVRESRLVGKVLYLATDSYRPATDGGLPQWGLEVTSFDLHDPANPVRRASIHLGGWAQAVTANDRTLLVAKAGARDGTTIDILDISDPHGAMVRGGSVSVAGTVADKFKLREAGGALTVVSQKWRARTRAEIDTLLNLPAGVRPPDYVTASPVASTAVHTFSLAALAAPTPLGTLDLALDETLHATRFDGDRLYLITAQHRPWIHATWIWDPLWIVDLADPAQPRVLGELEMPGYSTYIEPLGDRLVTIGLVGGQPTVSLFDISDATKPAELSRVVLGASAWTSSEAVWDEKAFAVLPEENLILMPLSSWDWGSRASAGVQLLDLERDGIVKRGLLQQPFAPRRATVHRGRIVAISPRTLLALDATDRDTPRVTAEVEIAWPVDRVFPIGAHVVQLGSEWQRGSYEHSLTVSPADRPDESLDVLSLGGTPLGDVTVRDGVLYVMQIEAGQTSWDYATGVFREVSPDRVTLTTVDVSRLPRLTRLGSVTAEVSLPDRGWYGYGAPARALWIGEHTLGFNIVGGGRGLVAPSWYDPAPYDTYEHIWIPNPDVPSVNEEEIKAGSSADVTITQIYVGKSAGHYESRKTGTIDPPGYWTPSHVSRHTQRVFAFDVAKPARPVLASHVEIGADQPWDVAPPVASDGAVFASYRHLGPLITAEAFAKAKVHSPRAFPQRPEPRARRHFLQSVDYADPRKPQLSADHPNLPGRLIGTTSEGDILFTTGPSYDPTTGVPRSYHETLHASALAGPVVHLLDQFPLAANGGRAPEMRGRTFFVFQPEPAKVWVPSREPIPVVDPMPAGTPAPETATITLIATSPIFIGNIGWSIIGDGPWNRGTYEDNPKKTTLATWTLGADGKFAPLDEVELAHETSFHLLRDLAVAYERANRPRLLDVTDPAALGVLGFVSVEGGPILNYDSAAGVLGQGLWIPAGPYGLEAVLFK